MKILHNIPKFPRFRKLNINMKPEFEEFMKKNEVTVSDVNFTNLFAWNYLRKYKVSELNDSLIIFYQNRKRTRALVPIGCKHINETTETVLKYLKKKGEDPVIRRVCQRYIHKLDPEKFVWEEDENNADYVYRINELINMTGSIYKKRRNQVRHVLKNYKLQYRPLTPGLIKYCIKFQHVWYRRRIRQNPELEGLEHEHWACLKTLKNYHKLSLIGGVLFLNGIMRGFDISDLMSSNTATGHFIKADRTIRGTYATLIYYNSIQIRKNYPKIEFLNAEQDLGLEKLKHNKEHLGHYFKVRKYNVRLKS